MVLLLVKVKMKKQFSKKIKPKSGWSIFRKPDVPNAPTKPMKTISERKKICTKYDSVELSELKLPAGLTINNIYIDTHYSEANCEVIIDFYILENVLNPNFDNLMKFYEIDLKKYNENKSKHKEELKQWKLWVEQEKADALACDLERAQNLLKKHGKL